MHPSEPSRPPRSSAFALAKGPRAALGLALGLAALPASACGSGVRVGVVRTADVNRFDVDRTRHQAGCAWYPRAALLEAAPTRPHAVVGSIEIRTTRPKTARDLEDELMDAAHDLVADALVPPEAAPTAVTHSEHNPLRRFYVFDDGRTQVLEAQAILYTKGCP